MKKLLLILLLLAVVGCNELFIPYEETEAGKEWLARIKQGDERKAMLEDGRIYIGMSKFLFALLWEKPWNGWIDRSTSRYGSTEWWWFNSSCEPCRPGRCAACYVFCFENGILDYWSEN